MSELEPLVALGPPTITRPVAYHFRFTHWGWAIFTLNDSTCEFSIQSDWGCYGYRWHPGGLSMRTLTQFIAGCDAGYLIGKLQLGTQSKALEAELDSDATRRQVRESICAARREKILSTAAARLLWECADDWYRSDFEYAACPLELDRFLGYLPEYIRHRPSGWYRVLHDHLLPFFCKYLREHVLEQKGREDRV